MSTDYPDGHNPIEIAYQLRTNERAHSSAKWAVVGHLAKYIAMEIAVAIC